MEVRIVAIGEPMNDNRLHSIWFSRKSKCENNWRRNTDTHCGHLESSIDHSDAFGEWWNWWCFHIELAESYFFLRITLKDNDVKTAINNAIIEKHYELIPIFQNYVFEDKMQKRLCMCRNELAKRSTPIRHLEIPVDDSAASPRHGKMLTPNKTNFNFDAASPFLINVTHRRKPKNPLHESKLVRTISVDRDITNRKKLATNEALDIEMPSVNPAHEPITSDEDSDLIVVQENLFQLTESNLERHLNSTPKQNRISLVNTWRNKVNKSRCRETIVPADEIEFDSFIQLHTGASSTVSSHKTSTQVSNDSSVVTVVQVANEKNTKANHEARKLTPSQSAITDSFVTAAEINGVDRNGPANGLLDVDSPTQIIRCIDPTKIIMQMEEAYMHTDSESNIVLFWAKTCGESRTTKIVHVERRRQIGSGVRQLSRNWVLDTARLRYGRFAERIDTIWWCAWTNHKEHKTIVHETFGQI